MEEELFNNPFAGALKGFKPLKEDLPVEEIKKEKQEPTQEMESIKTNEMSEAEKERIEKEQREEREDEELFAEILKGSNLKADSKAYWRIRQAVKKSREHNIQFDFYRGVSESYGLFWVKKGDTYQRTMELIDFVIKRGYRSSAKQWLESTLPENIKYGTYSKEQRIEQAEAMARKGRMSIEELAKEVGVEL
jgi:hypothetical protein